MLTFRHNLIASVLMLLAVKEIIAAESAGQKAADHGIAKRVLKADEAGKNLLRPDAWRSYEQGFLRESNCFVCDNGTDARSRRGITQNVVLNQTRPEPIIASCFSRSENVGGSEDADYSIYLDLLFADNSTLWGQVASFRTGTHDWQRRQVVVLPEKPVKQLSFYLLLRGHTGKAWFRDAELREVRPPAGACLFDGMPVARSAPVGSGFQLRDVAAGSDWLFLQPDGKHRSQSHRLDIDVTCDEEEHDGARFYDVSVEDTSGRDRAVTLVFALPFASKELRWLADPRRSELVEADREYMVVSRFQAGANGRISRYPLGAVADRHRGLALGIDPTCPAQFRIGYSEGSGELYLAYDLGLAPEKPRSQVRFCRFGFEPNDGFRGALSHYYTLFPDAFRCRTPQQGLWMPFAKTSKVRGWEDFGFKFKEGNNETQWDDQHGIITFRYTEPMTWWMPMTKGTPRTLAAALAEARRLAERGNVPAKALLTSGYHDSQGRFAAKLLDTPWCNGAVWSMNSMPGIAGEITDFKSKWNPAIREELYGPRRHGDLDGEYIDSSEGYVTDELDFRRDHFAAARTPLTFSPEEHQPAIFRGLIAFEYIRGIESDIHAQGKLMMANGAPDRLCWLAPMLDVSGTETDWHPNHIWRPMSDAEMLYRRAICKGKPFCFLMNTQFEDFSHELVERYMKRCLAYGMFPGFFSHNAAEGHYFTRPELYDRDRPLFKRYVPLCKRVAEAGWEPITQASSNDEHVYVERFGKRLWTIFNDSGERRTPTITWANAPTARGRELLSGRAIQWHNRSATLSLQGEDVAVIEIPDDVAKK
jgi:hypothetical protein